MTRLFESYDIVPRQAFAIAVAACAQVLEDRAQRAGKSWNRIWHRGDRSPIVDIMLAAAYAALELYVSRSEKEHDLVEGYLRHLSFSRFNASHTAHELADETVRDFSTCLDLVTSHGRQQSWYEVPDAGMQRRFLLRMQDEKTEAPALVEVITRVYPQILTETLPAGFDKKGKWRTADHQMVDILAAFDKKRKELLRIPA